MNRFKVTESVAGDEDGLYFFPECDQEEDFLCWFNELDEDAKHMLHSLAIYSALGGKLNAFSVQEVGTDIII